MSAFHGGRREGHCRKDTVATAKSVANSDFLIGLLIFSPSLLHTFMLARLCFLFRVSFSHVKILNLCSSAQKPVCAPGDTCIFFSLGDPVWLPLKPPLCSVPP